MNEMIEANETIDVALKALYDAEGNLIANPTQEDFEKFSQDAVDLPVDVSNTVH